MRIASIALSLLLAATNAFAVTYTIHADGSGDYPTIQEALDEIVAGDLILLGDGTFTGPLNRNLNTYNTDVIIRSIGDDPSQCIIDCQGSAGSPSFGIDFDVLSSATLLRGITITGGYSAIYGGALRLTDSSPQIINCVFAGNYDYNFGGAVHGSGPSTPYFQDCIFDGNVADYYGQGGAVYLVDSCSPEFRNCTFLSGSADNGSAIYCDTGSSPIVRSCTFWNNNSQVIMAGNDCQVLVEQSILAFNTGSAVGCFGNGLIWVSCSDIYGNPGGNWTGCIAGLDGILGNMEALPLMCNPAAGNYSLHSLSPCAPGNNPSCGLIGAWPVGCWVTITVNSEGTGDYATIQDAVNAAAGDGSEVIELLDGVYVGDGNHDVDYLGKALTIRSQSGNPENCIIDCMGSNTGYDRRGFYFGTGEGSNSILEGVMIHDGDFSNYGSAVFIDNATPTLINCILDRNKSAYGGAVFAAIGVADTLRVSGCVFRGNRLDLSSAWGGGAVFAQGGVIEFTDCLFEENDASLADYPTAAGGGACYFQANSAVSMVGCTFVRNTSSGAGGALVSISPTGPVLLESCTFVGNTAPFGNTLFAGDTEVVIQNSILAFGDGGEAIYCSDEYGNSSITISCTDIFGNAGGDWTTCIADQFGVNGNISADPQFCDSRFDNFSPTTSSPCAPFSLPNQYCELIGAWPVACDYGPAITSVTDVGNDQGRRVRVSWARSPQDGYGTPYDVTQYSLWRLVDAPPRLSGQGAELAAPHEGRYPAGDWDYVTSIPARAEAGYSVVCETLCDSTIADGQCLSTFFVSAETSGYLVFFDSEPAGGYSVDNLAPGVPFNFHFDSPTLLVWDESSDADFDYFSAYGSQVDVLDWAAVLIDNTTSTSLDVTGLDYPFYFLTAVDFSGNESELSPEEAYSIAAIANGPRIPGSFALHLSAPNPVRTHTTIGFDLPQACRVNLSVYDVSGRRVASLVDGQMPAGSHSVRWTVSGDGAGRQLSSGVYFYRMEAAEFRQTGRLLILK